MFFLLPPNILHQNESKTCTLDFLFLSMVEAHNELFAANASEEDEVDEEA